MALGAVLGLGQAVVVAAPRAAAGELHAQLFQHRGHAVVDILAAVVGVEPENLERELLEHLFDDGQQMRLGDRRNSPTSTVIAPGIAARQHLT